MPVYHPPYSPDLLMSFNPGADISMISEKGGVTLASGRNYKDFNIEEGKSSEEFMRQL